MWFLSSGSIFNIVSPLVYILRKCQCHYNFSVAAQGNTKNSHLFGDVLYTISFAYFIVICGISVFLFYKGLLYTQIVTLLLSITTGVYLVLISINVFFNNKTRQKESARESGIRFIKDAKMKIQLLIYSAEKKGEVPEELRSLLDYISSSPVKRCPKVDNIESEITKNINTLVQSFEIGDYSSTKEIIDKLQDLFIKRNVIMMEEN